MAWPVIRRYRSARERLYNAALLGTTAMVGIVFSATLLFSAAAFGAPKGGTVVAGSASIASHGNTTTIVSTSNRAIVNWQGFSLNANEIANFVQPNAGSAVLNRVTGQVPSVLLGTLSSNGQVYLINPNGVLIGGGARIDTAGFLASTLNLGDSDFLAGNDKRFSGASTASVVNLGSIDASGGSVYLIGAQVANGGTIDAPNGTVGLAAGFHVLLREQGSEHLFVEANLPGEGQVGGTGAANSGAIQAAAAEIKAAGGNMYALAINNTGLVRANGVVNGPDGTIRLVAAAGSTISAGGSLAARKADGSGGGVTVDSGEDGATYLAGTLDASGKSGAGAKGGSVTVLGGRIGVFDGAHIDASGDAGGGTVLIGGDMHGENADTVRHANATYISPDASIEADARVRGGGGKVVVWSDRYTNFNGSISARGGALGGDGGQAEVSSHGVLDFNGTADLRAPRGARGSLLLDPQDIEIDDAPSADNIGLLSANIVQRTFNAVPGIQAVFMPTGHGSTSVLTTGTLDAELALGDVTVSTVWDAHPGAGNITVNGNVVSHNASNLTLNAAGDITLAGTASIDIGGNFVALAGAGSTSTGSGGITLSGNLSALNAVLQASGDIVQTAGTIATNELALVGRSIVQTGGSIAARSVSANAALGIDLQSANEVAHVSTFDNTVTQLDADLASQQILVSLQGLTGAGSSTAFTSSGPLTIDGDAAVSGSGVMLTVNNNAGATDGTLLIDGSVTSLSSQLVSLTAGGFDPKNGGNAITEGPNGSVTAGFLTVNSIGGSVHLDSPTNSLIFLGNAGASGSDIGISVAKGDFSLVNGNPGELSVTEEISTPAGSIAISTAGSLELSRAEIQQPITLYAPKGMVTLNASGDITEQHNVTSSSPDNEIVANTLRVTSSASSVNLNDPGNQVAILGTSSAQGAGGGFNFIDSVGILTIAGAVSANGEGTLSIGNTGTIEISSSGSVSAAGNNGFVALTTNGGAIEIDGSLSVGPLGGTPAAPTGGTIFLAASGAIQEGSSGAVKGAELIALGSGAVDFTKGANSVSFLTGGAADITVRGAPDVTDFSFADNGDLRIGDGLIGGALGNGIGAGGGTVSLTATGNISETSGGGVSAGTLNGSAGGSFVLDGANRLRTVGGIAAGGDIVLNNGAGIGSESEGLAVAGPVTANAVGMHGSVTLATIGPLTIDANVSGMDVTLIAKTAPNPGGTPANGAVSVGAAVSADPNAGTVSISADGSITETPGGFVGGNTLMLASGAGIGTSGSAFVIAAQHVTAANTAGLGAGGIHISNALADGATASFSNVETTSGDINLTETSGSIAVGNAATDASGNLTIDATGGGDLSATDLATHGGGNVTLDASSHGNILLNGSVAASGNVFATAGNDMTLAGSKIVSNGPVTLIVDNQAPSSPNIGSGQFIVNGAASVTTASGDGIEIFTARGAQNRINGSLTLNGTALGSVPQFSQFNTWFDPSVALETQPFTLYFKEATLSSPPPPVASPSTGAPKAAISLPASFEDNSVLTHTDDLIFGRNSFPVAFGVLYGQNTAKADGFVIQASSFDIVPDSFSTLSRQVFLDLRNPATELEGFEIRPATNAENVLVKAAPGSGGSGTEDEVSCAELQSILDVLNSATAEKNYREACESARADSSIKLRNQHFYRPVIR